MAFTIKNNEKIAATREVTQGVYVPPTATSFLLPLADGIELNPAKELLDRDILTPNIGRILPRTGIRSVSGTIGVEARASNVEGGVPEQGLLTEAALGAVKTVGEVTLPAQAFADQATEFTFTAGDEFAQNDIIMIKFPGAFHFTPITAVSGTTATMLVPIEGAKVSASYVVAAHTNYVAANEGHPSFSVTKEVEGDLVEEGLGCRVNSMALENFTTGQLPTQTFGVDGLTYVWETGGADITSMDNFNFVVANATEATTSVTVSIDGGAVTTFTFMDTVTMPASEFNTVAELAALLNGVTGLTAVVDDIDATEIDLSATLKENSTISILFIDVGDDAFSKSSILLSAAIVFEDSLPPVILQACVYQNDSRVTVNEVAFTVENSLGYITSTCDANGRISSRVTARATTGTFNPYKTASTTLEPQDASVTLEQFNLFDNNTPYSLFLYAGNPTGTEGEFNQVIAFYMPSCLSTEIPEGDADDVLQYNISFTASSGLTGGDADIIVAYI